MHYLAVFACALLNQIALEPVADRDSVFHQDESTFYTSRHGLPADAVDSVAVAPDGTVWVTANGKLAILATRKDRWIAAPETPSFAAGAIGSTGSRLWAVRANEYAFWDGTSWSAAQSVPGVSAIHAIVEADGDMFIGTSEGLLHNGQPVKSVRSSVKAMAVTSKHIAIGAMDGLYFMPRTANKKGKRPARIVYPADERHSWSLRDVATLTASNDTLWFGADNGAGRSDGASWALFTGNEGLPYDHFTCSASSGDTVWFGTERGAFRYDGVRWRYRASKRWLPDDKINSIALDADGNAWIATPKGLTRITARPTTLAKKAEAFETTIDARHKRMGFVVRCEFKEEGNLDSHWIDHTDNDGLYTSMYGAAEAFRYGATKDPEAKRRAKEAFQACKLLFEVTGIPGFPARAVIPVDWPENPNDRMGEAFNLAQQKEDPLWKNILPRWPTSVDGKYLWKCDTSSDEICGHYFFYGVYHDLVADTEEEKAEVREVVRALTDHIVDNGFNLVDHDGKPTRWGQWSPEYCNSIPGGFADRGLQAVELFSFLNIAEHVTGDSKYRDTINMLCEKYAYHINAIYGRWVFPPDHVVPWDSNLAFLSYYGLLKHEKDPALMRAWRTSIDRSWQFLARQNDPFFNFVFAAVFPDKDKPVVDDVVLDFQPILERAIPTLRDTPLLLIGWRMENSHRLDVELDFTPRARKGMGWSIVNKQAIPVDERSHIRINSDHFALDHEQGSQVEYEGTFYLLPYYMGLYHGFIK